jgi:hypothetical protein
MADGIKLFGYDADTETFDARFLRRPSPTNIKKCCYCRVILLDGNRTRDHLHPKSLGGRITRDCCLACNKEKGSMTMPRYIMFLEAKRELLSSKTDEWRKRTTQIRNAEKLLRNFGDRILDFGIKKK